MGPFGSSTDRPANEKCCLFVFLSRKWPIVNKRARQWGLRGASPSLHCPEWGKEEEEEEEGEWGGWVGGEGAAALVNQSLSSESAQRIYKWDSRSRSAASWKGGAPLE